MRGLGGRLGEDEDEDGFIHDDIGWGVFTDLVSYNTGLVPIGGQIVALPINYFNNVPWDDDIVSSPSLQALTTGLQLIPSLIKTISKKQLEDIANQKMADLNAHDLDEAVKIIAGSARSMGIEVKE